MPADLIGSSLGDDTRTAEDRLSFVEAVTSAPIEPIDPSEFGEYYRSVEGPPAPDVASHLKRRERRFAQLAMDAAQRRGDLSLARRIGNAIEASCRKWPRYAVGEKYVYERAVARVRGRARGRPRPDARLSETPWFAWGAEPYEQAGRTWDQLWLHVRIEIAALRTSILGVQPYGLLWVELSPRSQVGRQLFNHLYVYRHTDRTEFRRALMAALGRLPRWATQVRLTIEWHGLNGVWRGPPLRWASSTLSMPATHVERARLTREAIKEVASTSRLGAKAARRTPGLQLEALAAYLLRAEGLSLGDVAAQLYNLPRTASKNSAERRMALKALARAKKLIAGSA